MSYMLHKNEERGKGEYSWLSSRYSFSFAEWHDSSRMGFGALRVLNDDSIVGGSGFPAHGHRDMEIVTVVLSGAVAHKDSTGGEGVTRKGEVQIMSAGTGVIHSEYNASSDEPLSLLQLWILPKQRSVVPRYEQRSFDFFLEEREDVVLVGEKDGALSINQDAEIRFLSLGEGDTKDIFLSSGKGVYLFVIEGCAQVDGYELKERDALGVTEREKVTLHAKEQTQMLVITVPMN